MTQRIEIIDEPNAAHMQLPEGEPFHGIQIWGKSVKELEDCMKSAGYELQIPTYKPDNSIWYPKND